MTNRYINFNSIIEARTMYHQRSLEYIVGRHHSNEFYPMLSYFSSIVNKCSFAVDEVKPESYYTRRIYSNTYDFQQQNSLYALHSSIPEIFLNPLRPKTRFIDDIGEIKAFVQEIFESMIKEKMPSSISINILPFEDFKIIHSQFGAWSNGILGFSLNGNEKQIFARENRLDVLLIVIGHEMGHILTETLPNKLDEEAKAFAFTLGWAETIKKHNIAGLSSSIQNEFNFQPAKNGLHDAAFEFANLMVRKGRNALELFNDLSRSYTSIFNKFY